MITILNQPPLYNFSKNPIVVKANTDKVFLTAGSIGSATIEVTSYLTLISKELTINTAFVDQKITFNPSGSRTSTNIVYDASVVSNKTACEYIVAQLKKNYSLVTNLEITSRLYLGANYIIISSKNKGLQESPKITFVGSAASITHFAGIDPVPSGVQVLVQVYQYSSSLSASLQTKIIGERVLFPDLDGNIEEDVSDIIDDYLSYELQQDLSIVHTISKSNNRYFIAISELNVELANDGTINKVGQLMPTSNFYALKGGVSKGRYISNVNELTTGIVSQTKTFLTEYPADRTLILDATHLLYFIYSGTAFPKQLNIWAVLEDDSSTKLSDIDIATEMSDRSLCYQLPIIVSKIDYDELETVSGLKIKNIFVQVYDEDTFISEKIYFEVDQKYYKNKNELLLKNSCGVYEQIYCTGAIKTSADVDFTLLNKTLPAVYTSQDFQQSRTNPEFKTPVILNTGHLKSRVEKKWLADLVINGEGFHVVNGTLIPIVITTSKIPLSDSTEDVYSFDIEFTYSHTNTSYSAS